MTIQCAIFDIGNVLLPFDYERAFRRLEALRQEAAPLNREAIFLLREDYEIGRIGREEFVKRAQSLFGHQGPGDEFVRIWEDIFDENPPVNDLVEMLSRRMPLYLLSNTNCIHRDYIFRAFPVFRHFRGGVYSYEVGLLKPDPAIFSLAAEKLGVEPARTLYLDDMPENARAAREAGFQVVEYSHHRHDEALGQISEILGEPVGGGSGS